MQNAAWNGILCYSFRLFCYLYWTLVFIRYSKYVRWVCCFIKYSNGANLLTAHTRNILFTTTGGLLAAASAATARFGIVFSYYRFGITEKWIRSHRNTHTHTWYCVRFFAAEDYRIIRQRTSLLRAPWWWCSFAWHTHAFAYVMYLSLSTVPYNIISDVVGWMVNECTLQINLCISLLSRSLAIPFVEVSHSVCTQNAPKYPQHTYITWYIYLWHIEQKCVREVSVHVWYNKE